MRRMRHHVSRAGVHRSRESCTRLLGSVGPVLLPRKLSQALAEARRGERLASILLSALFLVASCLPMPGTSSTSTAPPTDAAASPDLRSFGNAFIYDGGAFIRDGAAAETVRDADPGDLTPGALDAPIVCPAAGSAETPALACCGVFGFEDGTVQSFAPPACCAAAFSNPENVSLASQGESGGCGARALRVEADFQSPRSRLCAEQPFDPACDTQIGEISAALPGVFDVRGMQITGRLWLPADVDVTLFVPEVRAFVAGPEGLVYGSAWTFPDRGWQAFASSFSAPFAPALASVSRVGFQVALRTTAIPGNRWSGPIWFDALGWEPSR